MVEEALYPGMVVVVVGVKVKFPLEFDPDQIVLPSNVAPCKVSVLLPDPPFVEFHFTWTVEIVTGICGFVIVNFIVEP